MAPRGYWERCSPGYGCAGSGCRCAVRRRRASTVDRRQGRPSPLSRRGLRRCWSAPVRRAPDRIPTCANTESSPRANENTIVIVTQPAPERGQIMPMKGRDLWIFIPAVSQPVRLSPAQRLTGQVTNGDLAREFRPRLCRYDLAYRAPQRRDRVRAGTQCRRSQRDP